MQASFQNFNLKAPNPRLLAKYPSFFLDSSRPNSDWAWAAGPSGTFPDGEPESNGMGMKASRVFIQGVRKSAMGLPCVAQGRKLR